MFSIPFDDNWGTAPTAEPMIEPFSVSPEALGGSSTRTADRDPPPPLSPLPIFA